MFPKSRAGPFLSRRTNLVAPAPGITSSLQATISSIPGIDGHLLRPSLIQNGVCSRPLALTAGKNLTFAIRG